MRAFRAVLEIKRNNSYKKNPIFPAENRQFWVNISFF